MVCLRINSNNVESLWTQIKRLTNNFSEISIKIINKIYIIDKEKFILMEYIYNFNREIWKEKFSQKRQNKLINEVLKDLVKKIIFINK